MNVRGSSKQRRSSFECPMSCTRTVQPQGRRAERSGGHPYKASSRVRVAVRFFKYVACRNTSPQSNLCRPVWCASAQMRLRNTWFRCSATPLSCGMSCGVILCAVPTTAKWWLNAASAVVPPLGKIIQDSSTCMRLRTRV